MWISLWQQRRLEALDRAGEEAALRIRRWVRTGFVVGALGCLGLLAAAMVPPASATGGRSAGCGATVEVVGSMKFVINRYAQEAMRFSPGTVTIRSGCPLTFRFAKAGQSDAHSLSIVRRADLPRTSAQMESCAICKRIGAKHVEHPGTPPGPTNPIVHWVVNVGRPGLDVPGDSISISEAKGVPAGHHRITIPVTAPPGTILHFMCGMHPWMQGTIIVT
jgi:plastocyanin